VYKEKKEEVVASAKGKLGLGLSEKKSTANTFLGNTLATLENLKLSSKRQQGSREDPESDDDEESSSSGRTSHSASSSARTISSSSMSSCSQDSLDSLGDDAIRSLDDSSSRTDCSGRDESYLVGQSPAHGKGFLEELIASVVAEEPSDVQSLAAERANFGGKHGGGSSGCKQYGSMIDVGSYTINLDQKVMHYAWHPHENTIAVAGKVGLYLYKL
jgi:hypothetical protein